jgi:hypothetical protein
MAGINKVVTGDQDVYEAVAVVDGGNLVIPAAGATLPGKQGITKAGDAAKNVLGVAARRAEPVASQNLTSTDADGYPVTYPNPVSELTTVYRSAVVPVVYTAVAVGFGAKLAAAANGQVRAWVAGDGADAIIGECRQVGGVSASGGVGLALIK